MMIIELNCGEKHQKYKDGVFCSVFESFKAVYNQKSTI